MRSLQQEIPNGISIEKPATSLASLTLTDGLRSITERVVRQWSNPELFEGLAKFGIFPARQMLFYGPPGNGKTTACQWIAAKLGCSLYRIRCEQIVSSYIGQSAANMGRIMNWLAEQETSVVLFDEVESIFPSRASNLGGSQREIGSAMTTFWQYLDRWTGPQLFVMATNMVDSLDPALLSRIELQLEFGPPTVDQCKSVLAYWSEVLHEFGSEFWGPIMSQQISKAESRQKLPFTSFRHLWQSIQSHVLEHVSMESK